MNCPKLKKLYDEAMLAGEANLKIMSKNVTDKELKEIKECGFSVKEKLDEKFNKILIISEQ